MNPLNHVAIIMDGNGRWGLKNKNSRNDGHKAGLNTVEKIIKETIRQKIRYLTLFAFSTENWKRSENEVIGLMGLFKEFMKSERKKLFINGVKVRFIGDRSRFNKSLIKLMDELELLTIENNNLHLTIALNYGGRDEIVRATKKISKQLLMIILK